MTLKMYFLIFLICCSTFLSVSFNCVKASDDDDDDQPLYVTKYLDAGDLEVEEIQDLSRVDLFAETHQSYSGLFTVDDSCNSNLFFWFFESTHEDASEKPLVLWLQGGPGSTFLPMLFGGIGPYRFNNTSLIASNVTWTKDFNILFIEIPVGTGYSFTDRWSCYSKTVQQVAGDLYEALSQFYSLFPEYAPNALFIAGESYAGKFIPVLASVISKENLHAEWEEINLRGLFIGCGFIDPENQIYFADPWYELGIINKEVRDKVLYLEANLRRSIKEGRHWYVKYYIARISWILYTSGYYSLIDLLHMLMDDPVTKQVKKYIQSDHVRRSIHVDSLKFNDCKSVIWWHMQEDFFKSVRRQLSEAVEQYPVLLYSGERDEVVPPLQIDHVIDALNWRGVEEFQKINQTSWYVEDKLAGYIKTSTNLTQVVVMEANHSVLYSQPKWVYELFKSFVNNIKTSLD